MTLVKWIASNKGNGKRCHSIAGGNGRITRTGSQNFHFSRESVYPEPSASFRRRFHAGVPEKATDPGIRCAGRKQRMRIRLLRGLAFGALAVLGLGQAKANIPVTLI